MNATTHEAPLLVVENLSKDYELYRSTGTRFIRQLLGHLSPVAPRHFPAIRGVSFHLYPGEAIAILGRNGAGKSTLLQVITGLLKPSSGMVKLPPRVIGLLELGSGFNPEFTGRENVWINAAILGLGREEIRNKFEEIIAFADIGEYIDQPVRTYSSGMFLRLAFAVATTASPDLLLVDEVLAVGDIFFRQKCYERLRRMRDQGTAIVLVTHALSDASEFCDRGVVLSEGQMAFYGTALDAVEYYMHHERDARTGTRTPTATRFTALGGSSDVSTNTGCVAEAATEQWTDREGCVDLSYLPQVGDPRAVTIEKLLITDLDDRATRVFRQGDWIKVRLSLTVHRPVERGIFGLAVRNERNILVHGKNGLNLSGDSPLHIKPETRFEMSYEFKLDLDLGEYTFDLAVAEIEDEIFTRRGELTPDELAPYVRTVRIVTGAGAISIIPRGRGGEFSFSHYGVADLPNRMTVRLLNQNDFPAQAAEIC